MIRLFPPSEHIVLSSYFFWLLHCPSFFILKLLIALLVSSYISRKRTFLHSKVIKVISFNMHTLYNKYLKSTHIIHYLRNLTSSILYKVLYCVMQLLQYNLYTHASRCLVGLALLNKKRTRIRTNNDLQNIAQKTKDWTTQTIVCARVCVYMCVCGVCVCGGGQVVRKLHRVVLIISVLCNVV